MYQIHRVHQVYFFGVLFKCTNLLQIGEYVKQGKEAAIIEVEIFREK